MENNPIENIQSIFSVVWHRIVLDEGEIGLLLAMIMC